MQWTPLTNINQLTQLANLSALKPQIIFKHSTRCGISSTVYSRLQKGNLSEGADYYYLDLLAYRGLSDEIASKFKVGHESPQILIIKNGDCVYTESHMGISVADINDEV